MANHIGRRKFLATLGGAAAWPRAARAQQGERVRRVGALMNLTADDLEASARVTAFAQGLQQLGWTVGRNLRIDYRWGAIDADRARRNWLRLRRMSSWPLGARVWDQCYRRPATSRSCSCMSLIRLVQVLSTA